MYSYATTNMIISFDLGNESFGVIQGPKRVTHGYDINSSEVLHLFELEECLCLADCHPWNLLDLWMLKDLNNNSSWVLMKTVTPPSWYMMWTMPYSTRTGEVILATENNARSLYLYNFVTQQFDTVEVARLPSYFIVTDYVENLVSLKNL
ncbi:hypothetical protein IFM89_004853 [Coptis chinensis]|uniref:F-box associated beta-propeller type 3 domain-containing protein n=1 Tax=Coptis chinensis TaxID=261450 RepID=A0A835LH66_9MAGN|nr:hypothetical protein IFM89_004853 [Coptis chinensis]